jgi:hypothetical protein
MPARGNQAWLQEGMIRGHMLGKAMLTGDEELGKKDDDHRFAPARRSNWSIWNHTFRWRRRRILLVLAGLGLVYMVLRGLSGLGGGAGRRYPLGGHEYDVDATEPTGTPANTRLDATTHHNFDGRIRFYRLAKSLHKSASYTKGYDTTNRNILYAMSNLRSASTLLPMICEMSKWSRNHVHAAIMGRDTISLDELLEINGVNREECIVNWHDARPDYAEYSSDARAQSAVTGAMSHIHSILHPQAVITDDSISEDAFFVRGMRAKTLELDTTLIEVPKDKWENFLWITRLDAGSLKNWHAPTVDILIQVPSESSSVLRLLKSIKNADYGGLRPPRLILELPAKLDESVQRFIENLKWPLHPTNPLEVSGLVIKRRIMNHRTTSEEAAIRFLELFYPTSPTKSHMLLLSPQAQLSPLYFHSVQYALLEYRFSSFGRQDSANLLGISLELPSVLLDGKTTLALPTLDDMHAERFNKLYPKATSVPFLWQAPNSHAALYFGDKWPELHSFLSNRVVKHDKSPKPSRRTKLVSQTLPAWTEYMLEFMRARRYTLLYPAKTSESFVTIHNDLYHAPEEFTPTVKDTETPDSAADEPFLPGEAPRPPKNAEPTINPASQPLHLALPFDGDLPEIPHLPHLLYNGSMVESRDVSQIALDYANTFRAEVGGCTIPKNKHRKAVPGDARDLFCFGDEDGSDWEDDVKEDVQKSEGGGGLRIDEGRGPMKASLKKTMATTAATASMTAITATTDQNAATPTLVEADEF